LEPSDEGYNKVNEKCLFYGFSYHEYDWMMKNVSMVRIPVLKFMIRDLVSLTIGEPYY
jgi:hypothetical protein